MKDPSSFIQRLNQTKIIHQKLAASLIDGLRINRFDAQETFLSPGHFAAGIYYIESGIIRGAVEGINEKQITWFCQEGDIYIPQGIFNQQLSEEYLSTVTKTTLSVLPLSVIEKNISVYPDATELFLRLLSESIRQGSYREHLLRITAAKDRYNFVLKNEPYLFKRVPHYLIASYLNVTKETFSRLNRGLPY